MILKYTSKSKQLNYDERLGLIRQGKVKLRTATSIDVRCYYAQDKNNITKVFNFDKHEYIGKLDKVLFEIALQILSNNLQTIKDDIMLGNAKEALTMINQFENTKI